MGRTGRNGLRGRREYGLVTRIVRPVRSRPVEHRVVGRTGRRRVLRAARGDLVARKLRRITRYRLKPAVVRVIGWAMVLAAAAQVANAHAVHCTLAVFCCNSLLQLVPRGLFLIGFFARFSESLRILTSSVIFECIRNCDRGVRSVLYDSSKLNLLIFLRSGSRARASWRPRACRSLRKLGPHGSRSPHSTVHIARS